MLRFISYTRVSTDDQADYGTGLETQSLENRAYVLRVGGELVGEESDPGISGTIYPRPGIGRALERLQSGEANALIVHRVDRLGRVMYIPPTVLHVVNELGCRLFSAEDGEATEANIILFALRCGMAQTDYNRILMNMKGGHRRMAESGRQPNRARSPYGYHVVKKIEDGRVRDDAGTYQIVEAEAAIVTRIFETYASGGSLLGIAKELQREGVPTRQGGTWWAQVITSILHNPIYKGEGSWGKTTVIRLDRSKLSPSEQLKCRSEKGKKQTARPAPEHLRVSLEVPPIVTPELWQRVQERLKENARENGTREDRLHLFVGLLVCPKCLRKCRCETTSYGVRYRCKEATASWSSHGTICISTQWMERDILADVTAKFTRLFEDPGVVAETRMKLQKAQKKEFSEQEYEDVLRAIEGIGKRFDTAVQSYEEARMSGFDLEPFRKRLKEIDTQKKALVVKRDGLEALRGQREEGEVSEEAVKELASQILEMFQTDAVSTANKNRLLKMLLMSILPDKKRFLIELRAVPGVYL